MSKEIKLTGSESPEEIFELAYQKGVEDGYKLALKENIRSLDSKVSSYKVEITHD